MNNVSAQVNAMQIKERKDKRYEGRLTVYGNRKSFYGVSKVEIKQKAREYLQKVETGFREPKKIVLNDYIEYWLVTYKLNKIEPTSYTKLWRVYECQIKDTIGKKMIGDITTKDIQYLIDQHANPNETDFKPLARSGLKRIIQLLNPCFDRAVKENIIQFNPCCDIIIPTESNMMISTKIQFSLSDKEIEDFKVHALEKYKTKVEYCSRDAFILLIILNLGLRAGEMLALEWKDINVETGIIYINKTIQTNIRDFSSNEKKTYDRIKHSTKTRAGIRVLKLNDLVLNYIELLKQYDKRNGIISDYICCTKVGTRNTARNLQRSLDRITKKCSFDNKRVTLHTLRHTFGSALIRRKVGIEIVSELLGHANITITYNKYIHVIQEQKANAMEMIRIC